MASGEAAPAATQMQTVVLKVSIHCHGCKKKVRKVLKSVEGVHNVTVDAGQHKVTVTGTVDADTLVKRLYKSGKQALLLDPHGAPPKRPEPAAPPPPAPAAAPIAAPAKEAAAAPAAAADKKPEEPVKPAETKKPEPEAAEKKPAEAEPKKEEAKPSEKEAKKDDDGEKATEPKAAKVVDEPPVKAKEAGNEVGEAKKSKKPEEAAAPPVTTAERTLSAPAPLPRHGMYEEQHYYPPQPVLSYHAAQPRQSVSYYAPQPQQHQAYSSSSMQQQPAAGYGYAYPMHEQPPPRRAYSMEETAYPHQQQQEPMMKQWSPSYLYMPYPHSAPESYYQHQADYYSPPGSHAAPPPLQDSYSMFDDENPNACSVM
ncbi:hypothetical protein PR202_gb19847 [Eleusine coracana subsp. coracana]|uniref:HMA domain-containing protein n=1 Tax=Eleusine coracana subsp. coracana TaxID=191504 RepID=A0AAV5F9X3_ELECO|nr:hypothetical protein QOZ80_3BG0280330 [Eleusine coracana subsp. coracana]GJN31447.1 hypothetical protein PR202_gb19847 [Eleusine coracana subsp. coracana]